MSDQDYASFLDQASKSYSSAPSNNNDASSKQSEGISSKAPAAIKKLGERYYTSDSDEPFVDVEYAWKGEGLPSAGLFFLPSFFLSKIGFIYTTNLFFKNRRNWEKKVLTYIEYR